MSGAPVTLADQWADAMRDLVVRHPNPFSTPQLRLTAGPPPYLHFALDRARCTLDPRKVRAPFAISSVELTYFPGAQLARQWVAAAWCGYLQHEALELVSVGGLVEKPLDPHALPYEINPTNRGLRDGMPTKLTPETLVSALCVVMDLEHALELVRRAS